VPFEGVSCVGWNRPAQVDLPTAAFWRSVQKVEEGRRKGEGDDGMAKTQAVVDADRLACASRTDVERVPMISIFVYRYYFCPLYETITIAPAMAAGLMDGPWSIGERSNEANRT